MEEERAKSKASDQHNQQKGDGDDSEGDADTDDDTTDDEDYGPSPEAGVWAGSQKLQEETAQDALGDITAGGGEDDEQPAAKVLRTV